MQPDSDREDTNALYFIVGGLVVFALVLSFVYFKNGNNLTLTEPAAGTPVTTESTTNNYTIEAPAENEAPVERETNITVTPPAEPTQPPAE